MGNAQSYGEFEKWDIFKLYPVARHSNLRRDHLGMLTDLEQFLDLYNEQALPSKLDSNNQITILKHNLYNELVSINGERDRNLWCIVQSTTDYLKEIDARWLELILAIVGKDFENINKQLKVEACFVEVSEKEYFLGFLLNKCTQVVQIEIIQMIRQKLLLQKEETIYFRSNKNFISNNRWPSVEDIEDEEELEEDLEPLDEDDFSRRMASYPHSAKTRGTTYFSQMSQVTSRMSMLSSDEDLDLEDPFVRHDNVRQFRYLRAQFEDETLEPGEIPDLVAEAECRYDNKDFLRFKDELKFTCCYHEAGFILKDRCQGLENNKIIEPIGMKLYM